MTAPACRLRRLRRGVRAALALGIAASLSANVLHAEADLVARIISAWPPLALAITIELISRVPSASRLLSAVRVVGVASVASVAAWVSYWHMAEVAERYGETPSAAHLLPLSVDGMIVVASVCLAEIGRRDATLEAAEPLVEPLPSQPSATGEPPDRAAGSTRHRVAQLVSQIPADDPRSVRQLADDIAPLVGVAPSTARRHLAELRKAGAS